MKVLTYTGKVVVCVDSDGLQVRGGTDTGKHQKLGRTYGTSGDDDFGRRINAAQLPLFRDFNPDGATALKNDPRHKQVCSNCQIWPLQHWFQITHCGAAAATIERCGLVEAGTRLLA